MNPHKKLIIRRNLILAFYSIIKINSRDSAVCIYLNSLTLNIFRSEGLFAILFKIEDDFIPTIIKLKRHWAFKWFDSRNGLIICRYKSSFDIFIINYGDFEFEIFIKLYFDKKSTFLTSKTKIGILIFMEWSLFCGYAMKLLTILLPAI